MPLEPRSELIRFLGKDTLVLESQLAFGPLGSNAVLLGSNLVLQRHRAMFSIGNFIGTDLAPILGRPQN